MLGMASPALSLHGSSLFFFFLLPVFFFFSRSWILLVLVWTFIDRCFFCVDSFHFFSVSASSG